MKLYEFEQFLNCLIFQQDDEINIKKTKSSKESEVHKVSYRKPSPFVIYGTWKKIIRTNKQTNTQT